MGSSWIVVPFFFVPVPARSLAPFLGSARRDVLGENSRGLPRRQHPMNDRRKTQAIWVSPLLITNRLVSHKLARWDRCAPRTPSSSASTFRNRSAAHKYETRGQLVFASEIEYQARLTRDVRTFPYVAEGTAGRKYPFTMWIFALLVRRLVTRKFLPKDGLRIPRVTFPLERVKRGPIVKIHYGTREYISRAFI